LFWLIVLSRADLSFVYPFATLSMALIILSSHFIFGETMSDAQFTPAVPAVTVTYGDTPTAISLQSLTGRSVGPEMGPVLPAALILAAAGYVVLRKRRRISS
jgi:hypothetical protein